MLPGSWQYTLVGFSAQLDGKPLRFVEPLPADRVCSACGLLRPTTARLPCKHTLCVCSYEKCAQEGSFICPLDGCKFQRADIHCSVFPAYELLSRKVWCWNGPAGCQLAMAASDLSDHFHECRRRRALCPQCGASVLCVDVKAHLTTDCVVSVRSASPPDKRRREDSSQAVASASYMKRREQRAADRKARWERFTNGKKKGHSEPEREVRNSAETMNLGMKSQFLETAHRSNGNFAGSPTNRLANAAKTETNEPLAAPNLADTAASGQINVSKNLLRQEFESVLSQTRSGIQDDGTRTDTFDPRLMQANQEQLDRPELLIAKASFQLTEYRLTIERVTYLHDQAASNGSAEFLGSRMYLCGYCLSPGVRLVLCGNAVSLLPLIRFHKGAIDGDLEWPFRMAIQFSAMHPNAGAEPVYNFVHPACKPVSLPGEPSADPRSQVLQPSLLMSELLRGGFVINDRLCVRYEVIDRRRLS